jgi:hypothetical protein
MQLYFIRSGPKGAIKIGIAESTEREILQLQPGNPFELKLIARIECSDSEAAWMLGRMNKLFKKEHIRGGWFEQDIQIAPVIKTLENELKRL